MRYHYCIGLQLPPDIRERIATVQRALHDPIETVEPHITLLPPPALETIDPKEFAIHAKAAARRAWPLDLVLQDII